MHVLSLAALALLQIPCALTPNIAGLIIARFFGGVFAASTFNSIGMVSDMWEPEAQGWGVNTCALAAETGAGLAPVFAGYLYVNAGWRWVFGVCGIMAGFLLVVFLLTVPETRAGVLLERRAKKLRKETGDSRWYTAHARAIEAHSLNSFLKEVLIRPLYMLFTEPIVASFAAFAAFDGYVSHPYFSMAMLVADLALYPQNYAFVYLALEAIPLVYAEFGFSVGEQGLPFLAILLGFFIGFLLFPWQAYLYKRAEQKSPTGEASPEALLLWGIPIAILFPISML